MESFKAEVISGGRITIPDLIRKLEDIKDGDVVEVKLKKLKEAPTDG